MSVRLRTFGSTPSGKRSSLFMLAALTCACLTPVTAANAADYISYGQGCQYYSGHVDVEGKLGKRDIGEVSVFMPVACSEDRLLFTDFRFKGDNRSNREGNLGLGLRFLRDTGVLGTYAYFDRKESGITEKMHSQVTLGAEWLAETWDMRANTYLPLTGAKTAERGTSFTSDPYLAGSGIFIDQVSRLNVIREKPLYGADVEAGFKIPDSDFWLHAAAFTFGANDAPQINGVRTRATYEINDYVSLNAEGQYDNERGRMGWVGAKFTVPIGGSGAHKHEGLKARMTDSPVRDIDIVTNAKVVKATDTAETVQVLNKETGAVQRVLYVNNAAAPGGDGSKENPFSSLTAAQTALADNDIIYVHSGSGAGLNGGFTIDKNGVQLIGAGTNFVYDGNKFTSSINGAAANGKVLMAAGAAPEISNTNPGVVDVITLEGKDARIGGIDIVNSSGSGIYVALSNFDYGDLTLHDLTLSGHDYYGLEVGLGSNARIGTLWVENVKANSNNQRGLQISAAGANATIDDVRIINAQANNNGTGNGVIFNAESGGAIGSITIDQLQANNNGLQGLYIYAQNNASIGGLDISNVETSNNLNSGTFIMSTGGSFIGDATISNLRSENNAGYGVFFKASGGGSSNGSALFDGLKITGNNLEGMYISTGQLAAATAFVRNSDLTGNGARSLWVDGFDDSVAGSLFLDLGNAGYLGNNKIDSIWYRYNGNNLSAQGNWWGSAAGPSGAQLTPDNPATSGSVDFSNWLLSAP